MPMMDKEKLRRLIEKARLFLDEEKLVQEGDLVSSRLGICIHFCIMTSKSFMRNKALVRASALAYTTILALIPLLAVMVIVSTALLKKDSDQKIDDLIDQAVITIAPQLNLMNSVGDSPSGGEVSEAPLEEAKELDEAADTPDETERMETSSLEMSDGRRAAVNHIKTFISNVDSGQLGFMAMILMVVVAISLLSTIENTFNDMWGVSKGRNILNRVMRYWTAITLGPICLISAITITTGSRFEGARIWIEEFPILGELFFKMIPLGIIATGFSILYKVVPNTRVSWKAAFVGGAVAGILWQINTIVSVVYLSKVTTYSKIYGSLSLVPVFLLALYFSWLILLFGSQVAYSFQNRKIYLQNIAADNVNQLGNEFIAIRVMAYIAQCFLKGTLPPTTSEIAKHLDIASRLASRIIENLRLGGLLSEVNHEEEVAYTPSRPLNTIFLSDILKTLRELDGMIPPTKEGVDYERINEIMSKLQNREFKETSKIDLADLAHQEA
ncbi:YihY family inner membrane protein [bacterium]|nr:YihY family inner membrane protein [bacterium]